MKIKNHAAQEVDKQKAREDIMLSMVLALYNSGAINNETYLKTKRSIARNTRKAGEGDV